MRVEVTNLASRTLRTIIPSHLCDGLFERTTFVFIKLLELVVKLRNNLTIGHRDPWRINRLVSPLHPATAVRDTSFLLNRGGAGKHEDLCLYLFRVHVRSLPERTCLTIEDIDINHPVQFGHGLSGLVGTGTTARGILPPCKESGKLILVHCIKEAQPGVVNTFINFRKITIGIFERNTRSIVGPQKTCHILRIILPPVKALRLLRFGCIFCIISGQCRLRCLRCLQIPWQDMKEETMISGTLYVGLTPECIDTTAGHAHVAKEKLNDAHRPDILHTYSMLGPAHGIHDCTGFSYLAGLRIFLIDLKKFLLRRAGNPGYYIQIIPRIMLFQKLVNTVGIFETFVLFNYPFRVRLKGPRRFIVFRVHKAGENAFVVSRKLDFRIYQKWSVGIILYIFFLDKIIVQQIFNHTAQEGYVTP